MILCLFSIILSFFPPLVHLSLVSDSVSNQRILSITNKIDQIALEIKNQTCPDKKDYLLSTIEKKLQKAAQHLGPKGKSRVKFIMEGIRLKAFNDSTDLSRILRIDNKIPKIVNKEIQVVNINEDLAANINLLIKNELEKLNAVSNKHELLENIKKRVLEIVNEKQKEILDLDKKLDSNNTRRASLRSINKIEVNSYPNRIPDDIVDQLLNDVGTGGDKNFEKEIFKALQNKVSTICKDIYDRICLGIKNMNSLKCLHDDTVVPLDKLCNDKIDCPDRSDEKYCGSQAMERMQYSNWVMSNIEYYFGQNCFETDENDIITSKRNQVIQTVLHMQADFKETYKNFSFSFQYNNLINKGDSEYEANLKLKANEIAIIISSLALALEGALCSQRSNDALETRRKADIFDKDIDEMLKEASWPPKNCKCHREHYPNSTKDCKRVCWQQNSLILWNCESINGTDTISLNSLCDGKLDCFDESDEKGCVKVKGNGYEKFKALEKYDNVIKMVNSKASKERLSTQKMLLNLRNLIVKLQTLTMKYITDPMAIKKLRNKCYSLLKTIYSDILLQSTTANESEEAYLFLLSVNKNLGAALKRSHTGNARIIADGCYCRNGSCAKAVCSKECVKACAVEPKLMSYRCSRGSNATVSVDEICNNKRDCPDGLDELNCKTDEICRRHHLIILRNNLEDVGRNMKGTALGELFESWKTKVMTTIKFAEKDGRPKPKVIKNIVKDILQDLLVTYGSVENYRRSNTDYALPVFLNIAQTVMETLKFCGK